jgi:hypothetical protein
VTGEPSPISLDEVTRRLAQIDALLDGEARDPGAEQYALLNERAGLRALAARYRAGKDAGRGITELKSEMEALQRHQKTLLASRTGYVTVKGGKQPRGSLRRLGETRHPEPGHGRFRSDRHQGDRDPGRAEKATE